MLLRLLCFLLQLLLACMLALSPHKYCKCGANCEGDGEENEVDRNGVVVEDFMSDGVEG
jgi:hypothetical protein